eukprot:gene10232-23721_t
MCSIGPLSRPIGPPLRSTTYPDWRCRCCQSAASTPHDGGLWSLYFSPSYTSASPEPAYTSYDSDQAPAPPAAAVCSTTYVGCFVDSKARLLPA